MHFTIEFLPLVLLLLSTIDRDCLVSVGDDTLYLYESELNLAHGTEMKRATTYYMRGFRRFDSRVQLAIERFMDTTILLDQPAYKRQFWALGTLLFEAGMIESLNTKRFEDLIIRLRCRRQSHCLQVNV